MPPTGYCKLIFFINKDKTEIQNGGSFSLSSCLKNQDRTEIQNGGRPLPELLAKERCDVFHGLVLLLQTGHHVPLYKDDI
jgi:hypothetical protein